MRVVAIIPARFSSSRFPGKVVAPIAGKPMIQRVWERTRQARGIAEVVVATDDPRVEAAVKDFGGHVIMTSPDCKSGTERCDEVSEKIESDVIVNVQGDEPLINPQSLELVISPFHDDDERSISMSTLKHPLLHYEDYVNPNVVKVVCDEMDTALYFSRSPLPYYRDQGPLLDQWRETGKRPLSLKPAPMKHVGVYAYRTTFLQALCRLPAVPLETAEMLEQLRALAWGFKIKAVTTPHDSVGVDIPADVAKVEALIAREESKP